MWIRDPGIFLTRNPGWKNSDKHPGSGITSRIRNTAINPNRCDVVVVLFFRDLNGADLKGNKVRVQESTSGIRTKPGMDGDACFKSVFLLLSTKSN
jgi:hypothetical protein